jgi:hypothetical protein
MLYAAAHFAKTPNSEKKFFQSSLHEPDRPSITDLSFRSLGFNSNAVHMQKASL